MNESRAKIRLARAGDADGIARVHVDSWRESFADLVPERLFGEAAFEAPSRPVSHSGSCSRPTDAR